MRGNRMNAAGKERPHVPASGDVPFLPAVWDSPLWSDDSLRSFSSGDHLLRNSAYLSAQDCMNVRRNAPFTVE